MGAAQSSNVASAVANVANYVNESTTANSSQVNNTSDNVNFSHCSVILKGDFNVTEKANLAVTNQQISKAVQNADLTNNIQQQMMQEAASKVGFLGIGYASASNSASELTNATNQIVQDMTTSSTQFNATDLTVTCDDSTIQANNLNINLDSTANFLSKQTLDQTQTAKIVNDVSQTIKQKATATVEGVTGILIAIILCIAVLIYSTGKVASSPGVKVAIGVGLAFLMAIVLTGMYLAKAPPLFGEAQECIADSKIGKDSNDNTSQCINQSSKSLALAQAPLRYNYGLLPTNKSTPGGNLVQMAIASVSNSLQGGLGKGSGDNGGYRIDVMQALDQQIQGYSAAATTAGVANIPNPLMNPGASATSFLLIPVQYRQISGDTSDTESAKCTPGILQTKVGSPDQPTKCSGSVDPKILTPTPTPSLGLANLNIDGWNDYVSGTGSYPLSLPGETIDMRKAFARFVLVNITGGGAVDMHLYIHDYELIQYLDTNNNLVIVKAKDAPNKGYRFTPDNPSQDPANGIEGGGGTITGQVGVWNTRTYKFQKFMTKIGIWIILAIFVFGIGMLVWKARKGNSSGGGSVRKSSVRR